MPVASDSLSSRLFSSEAPENPLYTIAGPAQTIPGRRLMEIPSEKWYEAIRRRRSRRRFHHVPPLLPLNKHLWNVCNDFRPFPEAQAILVNQPAEKILTGAIGPYGKIRGAQAFAALLGSPFPHIEEQVGYTGEGIALEATACGLDTCWVGGSFRPGAVAPIAGAYVGERVFGVIVLGYGVGHWSFTERLFSGFGRTHKRKPLGELLESGREHQLPKWIRAALEAGRLAPSAFNRQPWRFWTHDENITIALDPKGRDYGVSKRLDCGIAMLHIEVAARTQGITGNWEFLPEPYVARFTRVG
jgi:nitroreductase